MFGNLSGPSLIAIFALILIVAIIVVIVIIARTSSKKRVSDPQSEVQRAYEEGLRQAELQRAYEAGLNAQVPAQDGQADPDRPA